MTEYLVGEIRCDCIDGFRVVIILPDGQTFPTDAEGTTSADIKAWRKRVYARFDEVPIKQRLAIAAKLGTMLEHGSVMMKPCSDCAGKGWLLRAYAPQPHPTQVHHDHRANP